MARVQLPIIMNITIGIDTVTIQRFNKWPSFSNKALLKIFTPKEINYCLAIPTKSMERFAARFAAKEAFFKALSQKEQIITFLTCARYSEVLSTPHGPILHIHWEKISIIPYHTHISITHTQEIATAIVILQG